MVSDSDLYKQFIQQLMNFEPKRRKPNSSNQTNPVTIFGHGCKGMFVTCDRNKESLAVKETYRLLEDYSESLKDPSEPINEENDLDAELAQLERKDKPKQFSRLDLGMKGIVFIQILDEAIDPVEAVKYIFHKATQSNIPPARFAARLIPIQRTCYAHLEDVVSMLSSLITSVFNDNVKGKSWFFSIKRRNNNSFDKDELIRSIAPLIDSERNPVSLRDGDICIHVDVDKGICGASIITDYPSLNGLSLRTLLEDKSSNKQEDKKGETKESKEKSNSGKVAEDFVDRMDRDWKCGSCGAPNFMKNDICWKCQHDRRQH